MKRSQLTTGTAFAALAALAALSACGGTSEATSATLSAALARPAAGSVAVSPQPGTPDASPSTQISFLGGAGTTVSDVHVVGSRSGSHGGVLRAYSTGTGESFLPSQAVQRRREGDGQRRGRAGAARQHELHDRPSRRRSARSSFRINPGDAGGGPALLDGAHADALDGAHHDAGEARRGRRRPLPRSLPGQGHAGADDRRPVRQPDLVPPGFRQATRRPTSRSSSTRASPC